MRILVVYASRHGATEGIADAIATTLREDEADPFRHVDLLPAADVEDVSGYEVVIVGSAVYLGRWLESARQFVLDNAPALSGRLVWLFSSGPVGQPAVPAREAAEATEFTDLLAAQGHRTFAGRLRPAELTLTERATIRIAHAVEGDYRDWDEITAWAQDISDRLASVAARRVLPTPHRRPPTIPSVSG